MTSKRITTVLGQLGLIQVRYVSPVRRGAAQGLAGRVYEQVEREFGVLAPSLALLSPAPQVLAASWLMLRETLLVTRQVDRATKETVATTVSLGNTCPWCVTVHSTMASGLTGAGPRGPSRRGDHRPPAAGGRDVGAGLRDRGRRPDA
jgi:AhpD family alkylhydroperoxidase